MDKRRFRCAAWTNVHSAALHGQTRRRGWAELLASGPTVAIGAIKLGMMAFLQKRKPEFKGK
jgi:hypothetical protein